MTLDEILGKMPGFETLALPDLKTIESRKNNILNQWPDVVVTTPEKDRERLVREMRRRWEEDQWEETPLSFVTSAAQALFDADRRNRPDLAGLRAFYYAEIRASTHGAFLDAMLSVYLGSYQPGAPHTKQLASALASAWSGVGAIGRQLLRNVPELLDPTHAAGAIASKMLGMKECWGELKAIGLRAPHAPGLMDHAHLAFVAMMRPALNKAAAAEQLFNWLKPKGQPARMSGAAQAITAVLEPWLQDNPTQAQLAFLTEALVGLYGDPRVVGGGAWAGVPAAHLAVLLRWLTGENIRFFLDVVSAVEESHMWEPRREFWLSLHEEKRIDAAWVAFSYDAAKYATQQLRVREDRNILRFGRQVAGGNRSLLILKIGKKIVVEGSHNYMVRIFKGDNSNAPALFAETYDAGVIRRTCNEERPHLGNWQGWVRERI